MNINIKIKNERIKKGMTQQQLADKIHKDKSVISRIENGDESNQLNTIKEYAKALDCNIQIKLIPHNIGTDILERQQLIGEDIVGLGISEEASQIKQKILSDIESITEQGDLTIMDVLLRLQGTKYSGIVMADVQCLIIDKIINLGPEKFTENDALVIRVNTDCEDVADLIFDAALNLRYEEKFIDSYGFECGFRIGNLFTDRIQEQNSGCFVLGDSFIQCNDKKTLLVTIKEKIKLKTKEAETYIESHPDGFPFVCFLKNDIFENIDLYFEDEINLLPGVVINSWNKNDATNKFLRMVDDDTLREWLEHHLVETIIDRIYDGEMNYDDFIDGHKIKLKINNIIGNIQKNRRDDYKVEAAKLLQKEIVMKIFGKDNLLKIFADENFYEVICFLPQKDLEMYKFLV